VLERLRGVRLTTGGTAKIAGMKVGILDVGANTVRLLVAAPDGERLVSVREERVELGLGEEIERNGRISDEKLDDTAATAVTCVRRARKLGSAAVEILVTSPGRQAENGPELVTRLAAATGAPTRVLSAEEEAELAWRGAVEAASDVPSTVAVCDVGGGSAQIAVGSFAKGPTWVRSVDIGSLRLTRRALREDPPTPGDIARATRAIAEAFDDVSPPRPDGALAVGGTARALRRIVDEPLAEHELADALDELSLLPSRQIAKTYKLDRQRARTITAGTLILSEIQRRIDVPLLIGRGGLREGAALQLLDATVAATA
jgi:exopolyphosphatase / guanosine-5'-triphosphate,3'-diphosphate pyrophosphatase